MRVYLASNYGRRLEMIDHAADLTRLGHYVTSTWIDGHHEAGRGAGIDVEATDEEKAGWALEDLADVRFADCLILFTDDGGQRNRGGKDAEFGYALGLGGFRLIVVGKRTNVFTCLPQVEHFAAWEECRAKLEAERWVVLEAGR